MCVAGCTRAEGAERAGSVDVLTPGVLVGGAVGASPKAVGGAGRVTIDVAPENDGAGGSATCKERPELGALWVVRGHFIGLVGGKVGGAHIDADSGADAQPPAPLGPGLCLERPAVGTLDGCLREHRVTE